MTIHAQRSEEEIEKLNKGFEVSSVCRLDLVSQGYDEDEVLKLDDTDMQKIAEKMGESLSEGGYWEAMEMVVDYHFKLKKN